MSAFFSFWYVDMLCMTVSLKLWYLFILIHVCIYQRLTSIQIYESYVRVCIVYIYICVYIYIYINIYVCMYIYLYVCIYMLLSLCAMRRAHRRPLFNTLRLDAPMPFRKLQKGYPFGSSADPVF